VKDGSGVPSPQGIVAGKRTTPWKGRSNMKICISSTGPGLSDLVDPRFSRCRYYIVYDDVSGGYETEENTAGMH